MSSKGFNPFGKRASKARKFHAVSDELGRVTYLEQLGFICVKERTPSLEIAEKERLYFQLEACEAIVKAKNTSFLEALGQIVSECRQALKDGKFGKESISGILRIAQSFLDKRVSTTDAMNQLVPQIVTDKNGVKTVVPAQESIFGWLSKESKERFCDLLIDRRSKEEAVIAIIANRLAYAVTLGADAAKGATTLKLTQKLIFPLDAGDIIKFGDQKVEVSEAYTPSDEDDENTLEIKVEKLSAKIKKTTPGFLLENGTEKVGMPIADASMIGEMSLYQLDAIYEFYQSESAGVTANGKLEEEDLDDLDMEEKLGNSGTKLIEAEQTGRDSGQESNMQESLTPALV